MSGYPP